MEILPQDQAAQALLLEEALRNARTPKRTQFSTNKDTSNQVPEPASIRHESSGASSYSPLPFKDAAEFVVFFDPALKSGKKRLYSWQIEELQRLSQKGIYTTQNPLDYVLLAANGSGKDAYIIAGFVTFVLCCWRRYKVVITSSSDQQLDSQTRNYIKYFCQQVNEYLRTNGVLSKAIDIKKETFKSSIHKDNKGREISLTGSEVYTFVTNEGGRAEGHHPFPDADPGEGVILIVNEAKTVPQEIFDHFAKCTYNYMIQVSSAGPSRGHLYQCCINGVQYPAEYQPGQFYWRRVTAYDCLHISKEKLAREEAEFGPNDAWFKNTRLSLFSSLGESVVITEELLDRALATSKRFQLGLGRRAGLDLSGRGNDYNTFYVIEDNELIAFDRWRAIDTEQTVDTLIGTEDGKSIGLFQKYGFSKDTCSQRISGDDNGIGQGIIDGLARRGWNIRRVLNQSSAINNQRYLNRGAEMWFTFARILEAGFFHIDTKKQNADGKLLMHSELRRQLCNRHYSQEGTGKMKLWTKAEEKAGAKGKTKHQYIQDSSDSPDDADALILAFSTLSVLDFQAVVKDMPKPSAFPTTEQVLKESRSPKYNKYFQETATSRSAVAPKTLVDTIRSLY